jgi:hypothetical protein
MRLRSACVPKIDRPGISSIKTRISEFFGESKFPVTFSRFPATYATL